MTGFLKYYAAENARHRDVLAVQWTFKECKEAVGALCFHLKLPQIPVKLRTAKKRKSWYSLRDRSLTLHEAMLTPLIVAHEVAHYQDHMYRLAERDRKNGRFQADIASGKMQAFGIDKKTRWHGQRHLRMTDKAVAFVKTLPFYVPYKKSRMSILKGWRTAIKNTTENIIQAAYEKLTDQLHCPRCDQDKPKEAFGMRVMSRDAVTKLPTKVLAQSYCRKCRSMVSH